MEPVSGIEPLTCRLPEACSPALCPLPALMPHESATTALRTLRLSVPPLHDPFREPTPADGPSFFACPVSVDAYTAAEAGVARTHVRRSMRSTLSCHGRVN